VVTVADRMAALQLLRLCAHYGPGELDVGLLLAADAPYGGLMPELAAAVADPQRRRMVIAALPGVHGGDGGVVRLDPAAARETLDDLSRPGRSGSRWAAAAVRLLHHAFPDAYDSPRARAACGVLAPHVWTAVDEAPDGAHCAALLMKLGGYLDYRGEHAACRDNQQRALPLVVATYGPGHEAVAAVLLLLGLSQLALDEDRPALASFAAAVEIYRATHGPDAPQVGETLFFLGAAQQATGERNAAWFSAVESLRILEAGAAPDDFRIEVLREVLRPPGGFWRAFRRGPHG
jgi:hypothetical protein